MKALFTLLLLVSIVNVSFAQEKKGFSGPEIYMATGVSCLAISGLIYNYEQTVRDGKPNNPPYMDAQLSVAKYGMTIIGAFLVTWGIDEWSKNRKALKVASTPNGVGLVVKF